jgi:hypothetical protein
MAVRPPLHVRAGTSFGLAAALGAVSFFPVLRGDAVAAAHQNFWNMGWAVWATVFGSPH